MRYDHGQHYQHKEEVSTLKLKLCKTVADQTADKGLNQCGGERKRKGVRKRAPVVQLRNNAAVNIQRHVFGKQHYGYVYKILGSHDGAHELGQEGVQYNVRNTNHQNQSEDREYNLGKEVGGQELCLQTLFQRRTVKAHTNFVLGFPLYNGLVIHFLCVHVTFLLP